jgi:hypothetical protein
MTINELSDNELTLLSSLIKQNKDKLKEIITGANKVNDVRTERLIEIVKLAMEPLHCSSTSFLTFSKSIYKTHEKTRPPHGEMGEWGSSRNENR